MQLYITLYVELETNDSSWKIKNKKIETKARIPNGKKSECVENP